MNFAPTDEQAHIVDLFGTGDHLAVQALAGTGKTTVCEMIARSTHRPGRYLTFSKALANEAAERMPMSVASSTVHSMAFKAYGHRFAHRLNQPRLKSWDIARIMGIDHKLAVTVGGRSKVLGPPFLASLTMRALDRFYASADDEPSWRHVPYSDGLDDHRPDGTRGNVNNRALAREVEPLLRRAWLDVRDPDGRLPFTHNAYLAAWMLSAPVLPVEFVLADEVQDLDGRTIRFLGEQMAAGVQVVAVGDDFQQIHEWRGATSAFKAIAWPRTAPLTGSYRFGPAIAEVANLVLASLGTELRLRGLGDPAGRVGPVEDPDAVLCRTNAGAVSTVLRLQATGRRPFLVGGAADVVAFARAAIDLQEGRRTGHPQLACFDDWDEVVQYVRDDPAGDDLKLLVRLLREFGARIVIDALSGLPGERDADVVVSTAHRSKGRGWARVRLAGDFPDEWAGTDAEERRLGYVAATRAKLQLDVGSCGPLQTMLGRAS